MGIKRRRPRRRGADREGLHAAEDDDQQVQRGVEARRDCDTAAELDAY